MINTRFQPSAHTQLQHVCFSHVSQGSIFLYNNRLLNKYVSATPKSSFPFPPGLPEALLYDQSYIRNRDLTINMGFLGYKMEQGGEKWGKGEEVPANWNFAWSSAASSKSADCEGGRGGNHAYLPFGEDRRVCRRMRRFYWQLRHSFFFFPGKWPYISYTFPL